MQNKKKPNILIVDDSEINRSALSELLFDEYNIIEANDGEKAINLISANPNDIDLVILDLFMPVVNGFMTLQIMRERNWLSFMPVIVVAAENDNVPIEKIYGMGAVDYLSKPYNKTVIHNRINNTLALYQKQKHLVDVVEEQVSATETYGRQMLDILGNVVEIRNGESNLHIHNVQTVTRILLERVMQLTDKYDLNAKKIMLISTASALHDIGKITIDEKILNKPAKLTHEEFNLVKTHSQTGAQMIKAMPEFKNNVNNENSIYNYAYEICRWHHERWNGFGYPDGLKGDETPISAQVVAMADVYDALTSERCYKTAYSHTEAVNMIINGECGSFNPLLYDCLRDTADYINKVIHIYKKHSMPDTMAFKVTRELIDNKIYSYDNESKYFVLLENEKRKFFSDDVKEIQIEYDVNYGVAIVSDYGVQFLNLNSSILDIDTIKKNSKDSPNYYNISQMVRRTTPEKPSVVQRMHFVNGSKKLLCEVRLYTVWDGEDVLKRKNVLMRIIPDNTFENVDTNNDLNNAEFEELTNRLESVFDTVRIVDPINTNVVSGNDLESINYFSDKTDEIKCYSIWNKNERCPNCISYKALQTNETQSKIEFLGENVYQVFAKAVNVDGKRKVVEIVHKNKQDLILDANGKSDLIDYVASYNRRLYCDMLTNVYNRRYYEEVGKYLDNVTCVAMIDMDNLKKINDAYGHITGDIALTTVAGIIKDNIRDDDLLIRYGGDEFVLLFVDLPIEECNKYFDKIIKSVKNTKLINNPNVELSVTIGAVPNEESIAASLIKADKLMYSEKELKTV